MYDATVIQIMTIGESKKHMLEFPDGSTISLYDFWKKEINDHINRENFQVLPYKLGEPWIYAKDTDYFVFCNIPEYSDLPVIFVRDVENRWFSLGYPNSLDGGLFDVTGESYNIITNTNHEN